VQSLDPISSKAFSPLALTAVLAAGVDAEESFVSDVFVSLLFPQATAKAAHAMIKNIFFIIWNGS